MPRIPRLRGEIASDRSTVSRLSSQSLFARINNRRVGMVVAADGNDDSFSIVLGRVARVDENGAHMDRLNSIHLSVGDVLAIAEGRMRLRLEPVERKKAAA